MKQDEFTPHFIMLIGVPGTGKSTYIDCFKEMHLDRKYTILSTDDIIQQWADENGVTYADAFNTLESKKIQSQFNANFRQALNNKENIIVDRTNLTVRARAKMLNNVPNEYYKIGVVFDIDIDEIQRRLKKREEETGKHIPPYVVDNMIKSFQSATNDEFDEIIKVQ